MDKSRTEVEQYGDELVLRRRAGSLATGGFLLLWLSVWTVGCVLLVRQVIEEPTLEHILFGVPFWASWCFVTCLLTWMFFGQERIRVGPDGLEYRSRAIITLHQRHVPLREVTGIAPFSKVESGRTEQGLRIETLGSPIQFGQGVDEAERTRLADLLREHLQGLSPDRTIPILKDGADLRPPLVGVEMLSPSKAKPEPPSDTRIWVHRDWDSTVFVRRGAFSPAALGFATFVNLFWNGIVAVFVVQAIKDGTWFILLFLSLHGIIGIGLFLAWLSTLFDPLTVRTISVGPGVIGVRYAVLGIGRTRWYEPGQFVRVELRRGGRKPLIQLGGRDAEGDSPYWLALIGRDGKEALAIDNLTRGEARWIGAELGGVIPEGRVPLQAGPDSLYDPWLDA